MASTAQLLMFTNSVPGQDAQFRAWYRDVHGPQLLTIPGIVGLTMYRRSACQLLSGVVLDSYAYLSCYDLDGDLASITAAIARRGSEGQIDPGTVIDRRQAPPLSVIFERISGLGI
jgi:hypothetical protein